MDNPKIPPREIPPRELPQVPEAPVEAPSAKEPVKPEEEKPLEGEPREGEPTLLEFEIEEPPSQSEIIDKPSRSPADEINQADLDRDINTPDQANRLQEMLSKIINSP